MPSLTPLQFHNEYLDFRVPTCNGLQHVRPANLRYQNDGNGPSGAKALYDPGLIWMLQQLLQGLTPTEKAEAFPPFPHAPTANWNLIHWVYIGIGRPAEIVRALQLAAYLYEERERFE